MNVGCGSQVLPEGMQGIGTVASEVIRQGAVAFLIEVQGHLGGWIERLRVPNPADKVVAVQAFRGVSEVDAWSLEYGRSGKRPDRVAGDAGESRGGGHQLSADFRRDGIEGCLCGRVWREAIKGSESCCQAGGVGRKSGHPAGEPGTGFVADCAGEKAGHPLWTKFFSGSSERWQSRACLVAGLAAQFLAPAFGEIRGNMSSQRFFSNVQEQPQGRDFFRRKVEPGRTVFGLGGTEAAGALFRSGKFAEGGSGVLGF